MKPQQTKDIQIEENGEIANIKSSHISVELNQQTGEIRFLSRDGKLLLTDTQTRLEARKDEANKASGPMCSIARADSRESSSSEARRRCKPRACLC